MKVLFEEKQFEKDGKKLNYKQFYVKADLGSPIGTYQINLKIETKNDKGILLNFIEHANFVLRVKQREDGSSYVIPVVEIRSPLGLEVDIFPKVSADTLVLLRLVEQV